MNNTGVTILRFFDIFKSIIIFFWNIGHVRRQKSLEGDHPALE